jgi:hypothetical protein
MLLATFADRRGIDISPRWAASVRRYFTLMFFIALLMILTLTFAKGDGQGAALTLLIGIAFSLLRYKAYRQKSEMRADWVIAPASAASKPRHDRFGCPTSKFHRHSTTPSLPLVRAI